MYNKWSQSSQKKTKHLETKSLIVMHTTKHEIEPLIRLLYASIANNETCH